MTIQEHITNLKVHGLTVLENAFPADKSMHYRNLILNYFSDGKNRCSGYGDGTQTIKSDGVNQYYFRSFLDIFDSDVMMDVLKGVTDGSPRWAYHSDIHLNFQGAKRYHSDAQLHHIPDGGYPVAFNHNDYNVYRIATYLQDHQEDTGGLFVFPGSHINPDGDHVEYYIGTEPGDIVIFDTRLYHRGGDCTSDRCVLFGPAVGKDNKWTKLHAKGAIARQLKQNQETEYKLEDFVKDKLNNLGIKFD
tara:strand:+ start:4612 stop:5352 length:741 start_codon:yes stop_codon:yes gene_type:complete